MFDVLHFSKLKYLFGTFTLSDENCAHTLHQVKFMPSLAHKHHCTEYSEFRSDSVLSRDRALRIN